MALGEQAPHGGGVTVRIAVDEAARSRDRRVRYLRVRHVRPLGSRQVQLGQLFEREPLLALAALAPLAVELELVEVVELPVVVAEAHAGARSQLPGARLGPGPSITKNQAAKSTRAIPTLMAKMRSSAPRS